VPSVPLPDANVPSDPPGVCIDEKGILEIQVVRSGDRLGPPGLAAVDGSRNKASPPRDPGCTWTDCSHSVDRSERRRADILRGPGLSPIGGMQNEVVETDGPTILGIGKGNRRKLGAVITELSGPIGSAVGGLIKTRPGNPTGVGIEKENIAESGRGWRNILPGRSSIQRAQDGSAANKIKTADCEGRERIDCFRTFEGEIGYCQL